MTRLQASGAPDSGNEHGSIGRLLIAAPLVALLAFASLVFVSWTGWGFETDPAAQLHRDSPWVVLAGLTGAGAGAGVAWSLFGKRGPAMVVGGALGVLPAAVMVTAYFADTY